VSIDFYNNYPHTTTTAAFNDRIETSGGANSLADLTRWAGTQGKPVMISEWSNSGNPNTSEANGGGGESPQFIRDWNGWLKANSAPAGGPGKVIGEVQFDLWCDTYVFTKSDCGGTFDPANPDSWTAPLQPQTANEYRRLW
jgi:hypothetical protein